MFSILFQEKDLNIKRILILIPCFSYLSGEYRPSGVLLASSFTTFLISVSFSVSHRTPIRFEYQRMYCPNYCGIVCFFFGLIGFWGSLVFYNSYLPDIAHKEQQDSLSAKGYSMGYVGSVILLALNLYLILGKDGEEALKAMRMAFAMTGRAMDVPSK